MTRHVWAREHLASYIAGGLSTEERYEIQQLLKSDAELAAAYEELLGIDGRLKHLFAAAAPSAAALEDRVIRALRQTRPAARASKLTSPAKWMMIAASLLLVLFAGSTAYVVLEETQSPSLRSYYGTARLIHGNVNHGLNFATRLEDERLAETNYGLKATNESRSDESTKKSDPLLTTDLDSAGEHPVDGTSWDDQARASLNFWSINGTLNGRMVPGNNLGGVGGGFAGGMGGGALGGGAMGGALGGMGSGAPVTGAPSGAGGGPAGGYGFGRGTRDSAPSKATEDGNYKARNGRVTFDDNAEKSKLGRDVPKIESGDKESGLSALHGRSGTTRTPRPTESFSPPSPPVSVTSPVAPATESGISRGGSTASPSPTAPAASSDPAKAPPRGFNPADGLDKLLGANKTGDESSKDIAPEKLERLLPDVDDMKREAGEKGKKDGPPGEVKEEPKAPAADPQNDPKADPKNDLKIEPKTEIKIDPKTPPKSPTQRRIIIRSGDIEFEVDSFDQAVDTIYKLIAKTQGGVVATTNSDKLANGKMRGTIVVRMPPEELDDFVSALRRDLGKTGELKNQRIGSQDVTKHYTDMESELRGLRVSEDRLITMLKDTKAQLKDLLAVEKQLAETRTRIERIEGELRYYANLAAMSTLTINLYEKEITVAATVVESERVQAGVETDDVDKAYQELKAAIDEFKGRVFQSELKQGASGQFSALLQFDVAPDKGGLMRDRLKQIGVLGRLEVDRLQKVEGGGQVTRESKIKKGDTQFNVNIYNLATFTPRETVQTTIVGVDVPGNYRKIRELLGKLKANVWNTSLQNSDAQNILGVIDFDIRRTDESTVQTALAEAGDVLSRKVDRSADNERTTDTRVRYQVRLRSVGSVTARETNNMSLAAVDVPASFRKVRDAVVKAKGYIRTANLAETENATTAATLIFDVLRADEAALLATLTDVGEVLTRRVDRRPEGEEVTDAKVGFSVSLVSVASLPAREATKLTIAVADVPEAFQAIRAVVVKSKTQVHQADLNEADRQRTQATLSFDVLRGDEETVKAAINQAGEKLSSQSSRQAAGAQVTDAKVEYDVQIVSVNAIDPRSIIGLSLQVDDVSEKLRTITALVKDAQGRVIDGPTSDNTKGTVVARVSFLVPLASGAMLADDIRKMGTVVVQDELKNPQAPDGKLALARINVKLSSEVVEPRDIHRIDIQTDDVGEKLKLITNLVTAAGGKAIEGPTSTTDKGVVTAKVVYSLPVASGVVVSEEIKKVGKVVFQKNEQNLRAPDGKLAVARIEVTLSNTVLVPADEGFWSQVRGGLAISLRGLSLSASILIVAILFVGPWLLVIWAVVWLVRRTFVTPETPAESTSPKLAPAGPTATSETAKE